MAFETKPNALAINQSAKLDVSDLDYKLNFLGIGVI